MTEEKFTELVNLYLDREISEQGLVELKAELALSAARRTEFQERCRLHQAMRLALAPRAVESRSGQGARRSGGSSRRSGAASRRSSRSRHLSVHGARRSTRVPVRDTHREHSQGGSGRVVTFPRWILGSGLAASFALGFVLLAPVFRDTVDVASQPKLTGVELDELLATDESLEADPLDSIGRSELRRYATTQEQRAANRRASIASQLRLMGLRPELTPEEKQLRSVSEHAVKRPSQQQDHAELLAEVQKMTPMPTPQILGVESIRSDSAVRWPSGFQSSLASFK